MLLQENVLSDNVESRACTLVPPSSEFSTIVYCRSLKLITITHVTLSHLSHLSLLYFPSTVLYTTFEWLTPRSQATSVKD